jgi:hypothetical protein
MVVVDGWWGEEGVLNELEVRSKYRSRTGGDRYSRGIL